MIYFEDNIKTDVCVSHNSQPSHFQPPPLLSKDSILHAHQFHLIYL